MKQIKLALPKLFVTVASVGALAAVCLVGTPASAQYIPPPPEYIVTTVPIYHEGHAAYWYGNHWHYRDGHGAWQYYHVEPPYLREHRVHPPVRHYYYEHHRR